MNQAAKRQVVEDALRDEPGKSDRQIADEIGVTHPTVASVRAELETTGKIYQLETRKGKDGKERKPPTKKPAAAPSLFVTSERDRERALIHAVVQRAIETGEVKPTKAVHVGQNTGVPEWYTPAEYIEAARRTHATPGRLLSRQHARGRYCGPLRASNRHLRACRAMSTGPDIPTRAWCRCNKTKSAVI